MSSELKLTGASGGNIILQGNDTITTWTPINGATVS